MKKILLLILIFLSPFAGTAQYIYTVAGNGGGGSLNDNCMATSASFYTLDGAVVKDTAGNMFIADYAGNRISKISPSGFLTGYAGTGVQGYNGDGISAISAQLRQPFAIALDDSSNLYFADTGNNRIRKVNATTGLIYTVGGNGIYGYTGDSIPANSAEFADAISLAIDHAGNIFIADMSNHRIRKIEAATGMIYTVAGTGIAGYNGDGILATNAQLNRPEEVILDASGNLYIADRQNHRIRKVDYLTGLISTVAGNGVYGYNGDTIPALTANLNEPTGISLDSSGQLYIADSWNGRIRKVDTAGIITTIAGDGTGGFTGDGGLATNSRLSTPKGVYVDEHDQIYISDYGNHRIRVVTNYNDTSSVWPGDADNNHVVDNNDMLPIGLYYYKIGPLRDTTSNIWQADSSANWGINQVGSNIKHIDCNGNGFIDFNDTMAIVQNFSFTHSYAPLNDSRTSYPDFYFVTGSSSYTAGSTVDAEIWLGTSSAPVTDLFGISFDISFNSALVQAGTVGLTYPSSWLGSIGSDAISLSKKNEPLGIAYGAITRTDGQNASGYGKIADLKFKVNSNISFVDSLHIGVLAYHAIDRGRNSKYFNPIPLGNFVFTGIRKEAEKLDVEVNPNPSTGIFHLYYPEALNNESKKVSVYNVVGEELFTLFEKDTHTEINLNEQPAGIYFLVVESKEGKIRKRVIKN